MIPPSLSWPQRLQRRLLWADRISDAWAKRPRFLRLPASPWSPGTVLLYCALLGILSFIPQLILTGLLRRFWPDAFASAWFYATGSIPPIIFCLWLWVVVGFFARRVRSDFFVAGWRITAGTLVGFIALCLGSWGSVWCYQNHVCMGGHMDHPPYEPFHFQWETAWILTLLLACLAMFIARSRYTLLCVTFFSYLMTYRFLLGSLGGAFPYPL